MAYELIIFAVAAYFLDLLFHVLDFINYVSTLIDEYANLQLYEPNELTPVEALMEQIHYWRSSEEEIQQDKWAKWVQMMRNGNAFTPLDFFYHFVVILTLAIFTRHIYRRLTAAPTPPINKKINYNDNRYWHFSHPGSAAAWTPANCPDEPINPSNAKVDIFYVHGTTVIGALTPWRFNMLIDEVGALGSVEDALRVNASCFNNVGAIYAPKYRATTKMSFDLDFKPQKQHWQAYDRAVEDVKDAFHVFLKRFCKNGRPFILAGHSQGAAKLVNVLRDIIDQDNTLMKRMVACYLGGVHVGRDTFQNIKVLDSPTAVNGWAAWSTVAKPCKFSEIVDFQNRVMERVTSKPISVNPLSWTTTGEWVDKQHNLGGMLDHKNLTPHLCGCQVNENTASDGHGGALQIDSHEVNGTGAMTDVELSYDYHPMDFQFFWGNIRQNCKERVDNWYKGQGAILDSKIDLCTRFHDEFENPDVSSPHHRSIIHH